MHRRSLFSIFIACLAVLVTTAAWAQDLHQAAKDLGLADKDKVALAIDAIAKSSDPAALALLEALNKDALKIDAAGVPFVTGEGGALSPVFEGGGKPTGALSTPMVDNRM